MRFMVELFCLVLFPVEVVFEDEADALDHGCLTEGVLIDGVGVALETELAVWREQVLNVQVTEERSVGDIVIAVAEVTVDDKLVNRLQREDSLILLRGICSCEASAPVPSARTLKPSVKTLVIFESQLLICPVIVDESRE